MRTSTDADRTPTERHQEEVALNWVGDNGKAELYTLVRLERLTDMATAFLTAAGVRAGDTVEIFLPTGPETVIAVLACDRLGARARTTIDRFTAESLRERVRADGARIVMTADAAVMDRTVVPLKSMVDRAIRDCPQVSTVLVVHRSARPVGWTPGRDEWWHQALAASGSASSSARTSVASVTSNSSNNF